MMDPKLENKTFKEVFAISKEALFTHCYFCQGSGKCKNPNKVNVKNLAQDTPFFTCKAYVLDYAKYQALMAKKDKIKKPAYFSPERLAEMKWCLKVIK